MRMSSGDLRSPSRESSVCTTAGKLSMRELPEVMLGGSHVFRARFLNGLKPPEIDWFAVDRNGGLPAIPRPRNALYSRCTASLGVRRILPRRCDSQIVAPVVERIAVF